MSSFYLMFHSIDGSRVCESQEELRQLNLKVSATCSELVRFDESARRYMEEDNILK